MATQRMLYSHRLVGILVPVLLVVLGTGCCGDSCPKNQHALQADDEAPCVVSIEDVAYAQEGDAEMVYDEPAESEYETGMPMGYREPGCTDSMEAETVAPDECDWESAEGMTCYEEEASRCEAEEYGMAEEDDPAHDDMAEMSDAAEEEEMEEEGTALMTDGMDESSSDTVAPWIGSEDETPTDPNLDDMGSDMSDTDGDVEGGDPGDDLGDDLASEPSP